MKQVTIQNNLDPFYTKFKIVDFIFIFYFIQNFIYFFRLEKVNQLKTSKTSSSFLLT